MEDHHDDSRCTVGWTAFLVALFRAIESSNCNNNNRSYQSIDHKSTTLPRSLVYDPVAEKIFSFRKGGGMGGVPLSARLLRWVLQKIPITRKFHPVLEQTEAVVSLRTYFLDNEIHKALNRPLEGEQQQQQLVILGAGLDSRAFRLSSLFKNTNTTVFEIDLPGMLTEKRRLFAANGFHYDDEYKTKPLLDNETEAQPSQAPVAILVGLDLSSYYHRNKNDINLIIGGGDEKKTMINSGSIAESLMDHGFETSKRTVWLMEGFTSYLTEPELTVLLQTVIKKLSSSTSRILATWITSLSKHNNLPTISMHKSFYSDPTSVVLAGGFTKPIHIQRLSDVAKEVQRFEHCASDNYFLTCHEK
eukprot:CAMPEP_0194139518 /NCGR_PEP_ID=MMETSP0152-20130528/9155_1 /TAXON_ID=1049557 /ORGANISM="Thalassiothrix antarctica, Strain L6-D1" /LENGTH=359 /DNA_ID=CAMNT_0038837385 /DNA_START=158 /DNA_END=1237 /DNA_ORIENTATION=+